MANTVMDPENIRRRYRMCGTQTIEFSGQQG